jgi:hypothetical protein
MSIGSVGNPSSAQATAAAQLKVDQQKLAADQKAKAAQEQLEADEAAIVRDEQAADQAKEASGGTSASGIKPALSANAGAQLDVYG